MMSGMHLHLLKKKLNELKGVHFVKVVDPIAKVYISAKISLFIKNR